MLTLTSINEAKYKDQTSPCSTGNDEKPGNNYQVKKMYALLHNTDHHVDEAQSEFPISRPEPSSPEFQPVAVDVFI